MTERVTLLLKKIKTMTKNIKIFCCDNADEDKALDENCAKFSEEIHFEFTAPGNPQKNGVID